MLLTKPLTTFLHSQLSPASHSHLQTLLLCTSTGKILSSASALPTSLLRYRATLASQLLELYTPLAADGIISSALPTDSDAGQELRSVLVQLEQGVMVITVLRCGLVFVAIGNSAAAKEEGRVEGDGESLRPRSAENGVQSSGASDAGSTGTGMTGMGSGAIRVVRRRAGELAKWLDGQLEGFELSGPL